MRDVKQSLGEERGAWWSGRAYQIRMSSCVWRQPEAVPAHPSHRQQKAWCQQNSPRGRCFANYQARKTPGTLGRALRKAVQLAISARTQHHQLQCSLVDPYRPTSRSGCPKGVTNAEEPQGIQPRQYAPDSFYR